MWNSGWNDNMSCNNNYQSGNCSCGCCNQESNKQYACYCKEIKTCNNQCGCCQNQCGCGM